MTDETMVIYRRLTNPGTWPMVLEDVAIPKSRVDEIPPPVLPRGIPQRVSEMTLSELDARYPGMKRL